MRGCLLLTLAACAAAPSPGDRITLPYFTWMDPYSANPGDKRYFDIDALMAEHGLSRLAAVELQNHYRDRSLALFLARGCANAPSRGRTEPFDAGGCLRTEERAEAFAEALAEVRAGRFESGWSPSEAPIVVFDLDETLISHDRAAGTVTYAAGWDRALKRAKALGKVALFTAKPDQDAHPILDAWRIEVGGELIPIRRFVDGVFTLHHLVLAPKSAASREVLTGSKDLRILDETLARVILVDDNPERVVQRENLRHVPEFRPRALSALPAELRAPLDAGRLELALDEIEESLAYARAAGVSLRRAFFPYSHAGRGLTLDLARQRCGGALDCAVALLRAHPELAE